MTASKHVTCHRKRAGTNHHDAVAGIGGGSGKQHWFVTEGIAIYSIKNGIQSYHILKDNKPVRIIVATYEKNGVQHEYLKTEADSDAPHNLLQLPECTL